MFTWMPLPHLPQPPQKFIDLARQLCHDDKEWNAVAHLQGFTGYRDRSLIMKDGTEVKTRYQKGYLMGEEWEQWVKENITTNFYETGARSSFGHPIHGAHADAPPKWKLYYLVDRGGEDAVTHFYKEKDQPVERLDSLPGKLVHVNDYRNLDVIDSVKWPLHQWVLMNGTVLHGVTDLGQEMRINLTIAFKPYTMDITLHTDKLSKEI